MCECYVMRNQSALEELIQREWKVSFNVVPRDANSVADLLVDWGARNARVDCSWDSPPFWVLESFRKDSFSVL